MNQSYRMEKVIKKPYVPAVIMHQTISGNELFVSPHWHEDIELNLLLLKSGYFIIDGKETKLNCGEMNIINSGSIHSGFVLEDVEYQEMITVLWDYDFFLRYCKDFPKYKFVLEKDLEAKKKIYEMVIKAALMCEEQNPYAELKLVSLLYEIGFLLLDCCLVEDKSRMDYDKAKKTEQIREVIKYIEAHYNEELSLELVASKMGVTPTYFSKKFRQATGIKFYDYLIQCRVQNARNDLLNSKNTITEIAYNNGFPNVKSFIENFKKYYHITPKQYRKSHKTE